MTVSKIFRYLVVDIGALFSSKFEGGGVTSDQYVVTTGDGTLHYLAVYDTADAQRRASRSCFGPNGLCVLRNNSAEQARGNGPSWCNKSNEMEFWAVCARSQMGELKPTEQRRISRHRFLQLASLSIPVWIRPVFTSAC